MKGESRYRMLKQIRLAVLGIDMAFIKAVRALSVKVRFFLMVLIISIIPVLVIGIISYSKSDKDIVSKISVYSLQLVNQLGTNINSKLSNWKQYGDIIAVSKDVQDILTVYEKKSIYEDYSQSRILENIMKETLKVSLDIQEPDMITSFGDIVSPNSNSWPFVNNMDKKELDNLKRMTKEADGSYVWNTEDIARRGYSGYIILSRSIKDINTFKKSLGYLMLQVDGNYLYDLYKDVTLGSGSKIYLTDSRFMVVSSKDKAEIGTSFSPDVAKSIRKQYEKGIYNATVKNADGKYLAAFSKIPESGWTVVALIPHTYLSSLSNDIRNLVIVVGILCIIVSLLFFTLIYRSITVPLNQLIRSMREVKKGNLESKKVDEDACDEVGEVTISYNKMIYELNQHIESIKAKEKQKALAEFRALQAQINPHFIANTLNNVAWLAKMQKAENIETVVTSLIQLLNASMGRGDDITTIREEIQNIKSYIRIQEFKNFKKIDVHFDVDGEILECKILKFILQPIMENAIIHGIGPKQCQGIISVKGYIDCGDITMIVTDTGVGMDRDKVWNLLHEEKKSKDRFSSIGLKNVNERIRLSYGDNYGLRINSQKGMFTSVEVKLPVVL